MGRRRKKLEPVEEDYKWPFEISIDIKRLRPRIAFLSGCPREYYPDDPGFSKFGNTFCLPDPEDSADFKYAPQTNHLDKPVSLLGYGMGGLLAPRFAENAHSENPAPNAYQDDLIPAPVKRSEKAKKIKWRDFVEKYEELVQEQYESHGGDRSKTDIRHSLQSDTLRNSAFGDGYIQPGTDSLQKFNFCYPQFSAFGMCLKNPRFRRMKTFDVAGPGTYDPKVSPSRTSFQITTPDGKLIPRVRLVCLPSGCDSCMSCGDDLLASDYYQTKHKYKVKNTSDVMTYGKYTMIYLSLCRSCYCNAMKNGLEPWTKDRIPMIFIKARHCNSVHDHQEGHSEFLSKANCKGQFNLARKEILYSRYFKDNPCRKSIW